MDCKAATVVDTGPVQMGERRIKESVHKRKRSFSCYFLYRNIKDLMVMVTIHANPIAEMQ